MNLETNSEKKSKVEFSDDEIDFDFRPITSGLGFHNQKTTEFKPNYSETPSPITNSIMPQLKNSNRNDGQNQIYQNELSVFYGRETPGPLPVALPKEEKVFRLATKTQRIIAYTLDFSFILFCLGVVLAIMGRVTRMEFPEILLAYPQEMLPLVLTLFSGFYLIYFSVFEKTSQSTIGKNLMGITVVNLDNRPQNFLMLMYRSFFSLINILSLGLFAYFDLQSKISNTKVIRVK